MLGEAADLDPVREELLVRVAQEGMRNVERHAEASEVIVTLCYGPDWVELVLQDDGVRGLTSGNGTGLGLSTLARGDRAGRRGAAPGRERGHRQHAEGAPAPEVSRAPHTVVVADDHPIVHSGMRLLLSGSRFFELAGEASNGAEAILRCEQFRPDALLLDLRLPDLPAATICTRIKERHPEIAIVILTAHPEEMAVRGCLKAGACRVPLQGRQRAEPAVGPEAGGPRTGRDRPPHRRARCCRGGRATAGPTAP